MNPHGPRGSGKMFTYAVFPLSLCLAKFGNLSEDSDLEQLNLVLREGYRWVRTEYWDGGEFAVFEKEWTTDPGV